MNHEIIAHKDKRGLNYCEQDGRPIRYVMPHNGDGIGGHWVHCTHPEDRLEPGDGYIPGRCGYCGFAA